MRRLKGEGSHGRPRVGSVRGYPLLNGKGVPDGPTTDVDVLRDSSMFTRC